MSWLSSQWFNYWWPSDKGNGPENIQWTALAIVAASFLVPVVRHWVERHVHSLHEKLDEAHRKIDHIINYHSDIPPFLPKEGTMNFRLIPEVVVEGKRLGRHVNHDDRSLAYAHPETDVIISVQWDRVTPVLDQGNVGSCTGNACIGILGTQPDDASLAALLTAGLVLDENEALSLYSAAEVIDGDGPYPPNDNGSSGLSVAQAAKNAGLCSGYLHALSIAAAHTAIQAGPFMVGSDWYNSFDSTDANGLVTIAPGANVRGGHEYECTGYDAPSDLWHFVNSWGTSYGVAGHFYYSTETFAALLASDGDVTSLVPLSQPAPTPAPTPTPAPAPTPTPAPTPAPVPTPVSEDLLQRLGALITRGEEMVESWAKSIGL